MAVSIRTAVAGLCAGLVAALLTGAPVRAEQHAQTWDLSTGPTRPAPG